MEFVYPDTMTVEDKAETELPESQTVKSGELVYSLPISYRLNYIFTGWYYDSDLTLLAESTDTITENTTLYPRMIDSTSANDIGEGVINYVAANDVDTSYRVMLVLHREASIKQDKDSQPRRYSVQPREDSRTGSSSQRLR